MRPLRILALFGDGGQQVGRLSRAEDHEIEFAAGCLDDLVERCPDGLHVRRDVLEEALAEIERCDVVFSDSAEMVLLRYVRTRRGRPPKPWLVNEVDRFHQAAQVREYVRRHYGQDPLAEALTAPEVLWFTITPGLEPFYRGLGVRSDNLFYLPMARSSIAFFFPEVIAEQDRLLVGEAFADSPVPAGSVLALGSHGRDWAILADALDRAGFQAHVICNLDGLVERPAGPLQWHGSMPADAYLESIRRAAVVVLPLDDRGRAAGQLSCALPMRMGKAIAASRLESLSAHIRDGETGLSVPVGDPGSLASAIRRLMADGVLRTRLGEAAVRREAELSEVADRALVEIQRRLAAQNRA